MELLYSMRRAPLSIDPPYLESVNGGPTICALSTGNTAAFSSLTKLGKNSEDSWGSHVYVCDINTPWNATLVASYVHQVSALEWDTEGWQLLVATSAGDIEIYGSHEHVLNDWSRLYSAVLPGEHIIKAAFFHNGRRLVMNCDKKSEQVPCTERLQYARTAPTLRGFGRVGVEGGVVVTATGLVAAFMLPQPTHALPLTTESLLANRTNITCADICYTNDGKLLVCVSGASCVKCVRVCVRHANNTTTLNIQPLPGFYRKSSQGESVRLVRWLQREDTDTVVVCSASASTPASAPASLLQAWTLSERTLPLHARVAQTCYKTVEWSETASYRVSDAGILSLCCSRSQLCSAPAPAAAPVSPYVLVGCTDNTIRLLTPNLTRVCSIAVSPSGGGVSESAAPTSGAPTPAKVSKLGALPKGVESALVSCCDISALGCVCLCVDTHSQLHLYKLPQPATDTPTPLSVQQATCLLEYALVGGCDYLDVLLTLQPPAAEAVYDRITECFQRQPAAFQQHYYSAWLCLRAALSRVQGEGQGRASELTSLLMLHATANSFRALLRPAELGAHDKGPAESLAALLHDDSPNTWDIHKVLMVLEAKDFTAEPAALQSLRRLIQRVADTALAALHAHAAPPSPAYQPQAKKYELCADPGALHLMRELLVTSRVWGLLRAQALPVFARAPEHTDVVAALYRLLSRLVCQPAHTEALAEECLALTSQVSVARVWESPPRCCVAAPHGQHFPLYLEYGVEPEQLKFSCEPPPLEGGIADTDIDAIRYIYLGSRARAVRRCARCGARALAAANSARTHTQRAWDARWTTNCRCGGRWYVEVSS